MGNKYCDRCGVIVEDDEWKTTSEFKCVCLDCYDLILDDLCAEGW